MKLAMFFLAVSDGRSFSKESVQTCEPRSEESKLLLYVSLRDKRPLSLFPLTHSRYLQDEVHHPLAGLEQQLLEPHAEDFSLQSVSHGVAHTQLVANLVQTGVPAERRKRAVGLILLVLFWFFTGSLLVLTEVSPLLDFVEELSEHRAPEVDWQTAGDVVFDEGFDHGLEEAEGRGDTSVTALSSHRLLQLQPPADLVAVGADQAVDVVVGCGLRVRVAVFSQSFAGVPVAGQTLLVQVDVDGRVELRNNNKQVLIHC